MQTKLQELIISGDEQGLDRYLDRLSAGNWSFVTIIDSLIPSLVMETNLNFNNFHVVKMALFLRRLAHLFSPETQRALAGVVLKELMYREWVDITAKPRAHTLEEIIDPVEQMLLQIQRGNVHNAFFYALRACQKDKHSCFAALLRLSTQSLEDTLGHSFSCFYPVIEDVLDVDHPGASTALLSYIMYLCRFPYGVEPSGLVDLPDHKKLLQTCASGQGIYSIHHMITYYLFTQWENAPWRASPLPWDKLIAWVGDKPRDEERIAYLSNLTQVAPLDSYESWQKVFATHDSKQIVQHALALLDHSWDQGCDWIFRIYAQYYSPDWDPHYFTGIYAALGLYKQEKDGALALMQAFEYFLEDQN